MDEPDSYKRFLNASPWLAAVAAVVSFVGLRLVFPDALGFEAFEAAVKCGVVVLFGAVLGVALFLGRFRNLGQTRILFSLVLLIYLSRGLVGVDVPRLVEMQSLVEQMRHLDRTTVSAAELQSDKGTRELEDAELIRLLPLLRSAELVSLSGGRGTWKGELSLRAPQGLKTSFEARVTENDPGDMFLSRSTDVGIMTVKVPGAAEFTGR
jgi:hypothetical protein